MQVSVRFLSYLSQLVGTKQVEISLPKAARVSDLCNTLKEMYPDQTPLLSAAVYMVNQHNAGPDTPLVDGAQVLVMLILSGG